MQGVEIDRDRKVAQVLDDQRLHVIPIQSTYSRCKSWQRQAVDARHFQFMPKSLQAMMDVAERSTARFRAMFMLSLLRQWKGHPAVP